MNRPNLRVALLLAAGALVAGTYTVIGIVTGRPDFLVAALFCVLGAGAVDGFVRRSVTGRYGAAYLPAFAGFAGATAVALLATGAVVGGAVLLTIAAGAAVMQRFDSRKRRAAQAEDPAPAPPEDPAP